MSLLTSFGYKLLQFLSVSHVMTGREMSPAILPGDNLFLENCKDGVEIINKQVYLCKIKTDGREMFMRAHLAKCAGTDQRRWLFMQDSDAHKSPFLQEEVKLLARVASLHRIGTPIIEQ